MNKKFIILIIVLLSGSVYSQSVAIIAKLMQEQESAWNNGDIEGFMASYWNDDSLKFIGKNGITYGWKSTLENYKKNYPDKATMGELHFSIISVEQLSDTSCFVIGKWHLTRKKDDVGGYYTLLWKNIDGSWVIVTDHSS